MSDLSIFCSGRIKKTQIFSTFLNINNMSKTVRFNDLVVYLSTYTFISVVILITQTK